MTKQANGRQAGRTAVRKERGRTHLRWKQCDRSSMAQTGPWHCGSMICWEECGGCKQRGELPTNVTEIDQQLVAASDKDTGNATGI